MSDDTARRLAQAYVDGLSAYADAQGKWLPMWDDVDLADREATFQVMSSLLRRGVIQPGPAAHSLPMSRR